MSNIFIEAVNISKVYDPDMYLIRGKNFYALKNVNFVLEEGAFISIMGPSGSGKSTLLNCTSTLDNITSGHIYIRGRDLASFSQNEICDFRYESIGFIFQDHNLIPYLKIADNIASPAMLANVDSNKIKDRMNSLAKDLDILKILDKYPTECSGGECQRAAIARALINNPDILFCDEPTGNLDSKNSRKVLEILTKLNNEGKTILLVTHDPLIASYSSKMMYLYDGNIQTVIYRNDSKQLDYYHQINSVVSTDSLLKDIGYAPKEVSQNITNIQTKKKEFLSRQEVYMYLNSMKLDNQVIERNTMALLDQNQITYTNKYNDSILIDLNHIKEIRLDLTKTFLNFGIYSQFIFFVLMDLISDEGTYKFKLNNKDDFIHILNTLKQTNIPIIDPRNIEKAYKEYPEDLQRQKCFMRENKDLIKK